MLYRLKMQMENIASAVTARVKRFLERMEGHARVRMVLFFALLVPLGGVMFLLNMHTPLMMDDYDRREDQWTHGHICLSGGALPALGWTQRRPCTGAAVFIHG